MIRPVVGQFRLSPPVAGDGRSPATVRTKGYTAGDPPWDMDWRDFVTIALAGVLGMVGGAFGPVGILAGVVLGAAAGARWGTRADRPGALEDGVAESASDPASDDEA